MASGSGWSRIIHLKEEEEESLRKSTWIATAEDPPGCRSSLPSPTSSGAIRGTGPVEHTVRPQESNRQQRRGYHVDIGVQRAVRTTEDSRLKLAQCERQIGRRLGSSPPFCFRRFQDGPAIRRSRRNFSSSLRRWSRSDSSDRLTGMTTTMRRSQSPTEKEAMGSRSQTAVPPAASQTDGTGRGQKYQITKHTGENGQHDRTEKRR